MNAQYGWRASAPRPANESATGSGAAGALILCHAVQSVASPGTSRTPASTIPSRARLRAVQPKATAIKRLTEASSRKSMLSANRETEPMASATANSTPKYPRFSRATRRTTRPRPVFEVSKGTILKLLRFRDLDANLLELMTADSDRHHDRDAAAPSYMKTIGRGPSAKPVES